MMKKKMTVLLFALGVLCVLTGVFFLVKSRSAAYEEEQKVSYDTLIDLTANKIARIEWETSDGEKLAFAREGGEFIRELSVSCRTQGLVLSIDAYVPTYTGYLGRAELARVADYIVCMCYDEHTSGSETAGSVYAIYEGEPDTVYSVQPSIKAAVEKKLSDFTG